MAPTPRPRTSPAVDRRRGSPSSEPVPVQSELAQLFQHDIHDLRALIICSICVKPLYEPFTVACGHTFCYNCLTQWFKSHRRRKTCPECRAAVRAEPAPAYLLRNMVHTFISRPELLEDGETTAEHLALQRAESDKLERDKANADPQTGGLFEGCFKHNPLARFPINDLEDGVERCPECAWELEDGECATCGFTLDMISSSGFDSDELGDAVDSQFDTDMGEAMDLPPDYPPNYPSNYGEAFQNTFWWHAFTTNVNANQHAPFGGPGDDEDDDDSSEEDGDEYDSEMEDFIVGDGPDDDASDETEQDTVVGDHSYLTISSGMAESSSPFGAHPPVFDSDASTHDTSSEAESTVNYAGGTTEVVQLVSSDDNADEGPESDDSEDSDDQPIRAPGRAVRAPQRIAAQSNHRNPPTRSRASRGFRTHPSTRPEVVNVDDDSDESPRRPTRARGNNLGRHYQRRSHRRRERGARAAVRVS